MFIENFYKLVTVELESHPNFSAALEKASRRFINDNAVTVKAQTSTKSPELIAKYCDLLLKKSPKNPDESEIVETLNSVMLIFKHIEDKDVFQTFYSKMLAKRLINGTSVSDYLESQMISKLKHNCGYEYTNKLARMFNDITSSKELVKKFNESSYSKNVKEHFDCLILATGCWPISPPTSNFNIPNSLAKSLNYFESFYKEENGSHRLIWLMQFSKGELRTRYLNFKNGYIFQCNAYQIGILLLFNDRDTLSTEEIQEATSLADLPLTSTLWSLYNLKILLKAPKKVTGITKNSKFKLNDKFASKKQKVLLNIPITGAMTQKQEGGEDKVEENNEQQDKSKVQKTLEEDRKIYIQAAIVRVMKDRKKMNHVQLINAVVDQLKSRFKPKVPIIKKCIDMLMEKGYLNRIEGERDAFVYVA